MAAWSPTSGSAMRWRRSSPRRSPRRAACSSKRWSAWPRPSAAAKPGLGDRRRRRRHRWPTPPQTQAAINLLNAAAGNVGKTVRFGPDSAYGKITPYAEVAKLVQAMAAGEIEVLVLGTGREPGVHAARRAQGRGRHPQGAVRGELANLPDETTALAHLVLPDTHWLESWGDYSPREGVAGLMQPTMQPIRDSRAFGDVLLAVGRTVLGTEEGKGPLPWASFEQYREGGVGADREGPAGRRRSTQGGVWQDVARGGGDGRRSSGSTLRPPKLEGDGRRASRCSRIRRSASTTAAARAARGCRKCRTR